MDRDKVYSALFLENSSLVWILPWYVTIGTRNDCHIIKGLTNAWKNSSLVWILPWYVTIGNELCSFLQASFKSKLGKLFPLYR